MARAVKSVGIVGGGLAGLTLAALLAQRGHKVTVYEQDKWGGKLRREQVAGHTFDTGPSLFTFPEVWQTLLARLGESDPLEWQALGGLGLHHTPYGAVPLPVPPEHPLFGEWQRYTRKAAPLRPHMLALLTTPPRLTDPRFVQASRALLGVVFPHLSAQKWLDAQGFSPMLRHALAAHALNAGLPPQDASALYALIPALVGQQVYRPARGMGAVLDTLRHLTEARGVGLEEGVAVRRLAPPNLHFLGGTTARHEVLVSAIDPQRLALLRGLASPSPLARRTVSGVALYAALPQPAPLPPTSVLPPSDYAAFRRDLHAGTLPADTLTLVHAEGHKLAVLLSVPALSRDLSAQHPWVQAQLGRVERVLGVPHLQRDLRRGADLLTLAPLHYAAGGHAGGAIYGASAALLRAGPFHPQPYRLLRRQGQQLWQVGTGVHPGGGLPAIFGGALIVDQLMRESGV